MSESFATPKKQIPSDYLSEDFDSTKLTVQQLKSILTEKDVTLTPDLKKKADFVRVFDDYRTQYLQDEARKVLNMFN
jgi:hypothetical protein